MIEKRCRETIKLLKHKGAEYADIRIHTRDETEGLGTRCGTVDFQNYISKKGFGIRVMSGGAWGFASGEDYSLITSVAIKALENSQVASGLLENKLELMPKEVVKAVYVDPVGIDPFTVPLDDKIAYLIGLDSKIKKNGLSYWGAQSIFYRKEILYFDSEGAEICKKLSDVKASLYCFANDKDGKQRRRFHHLYYDADGKTGWECLTDEAKFASHAPRVSDELLQLCQAPLLEKDNCDLILLNNQMALQTHETIGHALELDRILGYELSYAGGSFVGLNDFGRLQYGSPLLTARANGLVPNSPGTFGYDDDGVAASDVTLIKKGVLQGAITSRQMTMEANKKSGKEVFDKSGGANRATSYNRAPIERMNNINIDWGHGGSYEDIIASCENGVVMETPESWSIGSDRENFHFACEIGWKVKDGKITNPVRNPSYRGDTLKFWNSLKRVGSKETWRLELVYNCGKGQPNQVAHLGHGVPICLFENVAVGE